MNAEVVKVCVAVREAGGRAVLVGGSVRDRLLGIESKDFDIEAYGIEPARLREVLETLGQVNTVGEHFAVYKLIFNRPQQPEDDSNQQQRFEIDISIPRRESKSGVGHRGFVIEGDPSMTFEQAARRRDFTINAISCDPLTDELIDPYGGCKDLNQRRLKAVAADTFIEDSLRVLRAVQLAARFRLTIEPETIKLCLSIDLSDLPHERIWGEIEKLLTLAELPSIGLRAAVDLGVVDQLFPELRSQNPLSTDDHLAKDAFDHAGRSLDEAARRSSDLSKQKRIAVMMSTLCHELASSKEAAKGPTLSIMNTMGLYTIGGYDVRSQVLALVREHRKPIEFYRRRETVTDGDFRRLAERVDIDLLYRTAMACAKARGEGSTQVDWFIERARKLGVEHGPPSPLLQGRHLLAAGFAPGPQIGKLLRRVYELQLDGIVTTQEEALAAALQIGEAGHQKV